MAKRQSAARVSQPVLEEQATVYRSAIGGRRYLTRAAAMKHYANAKLRAKHPCECEQGDYASGYPGFDCGCGRIFERIRPRYLRVLKRAVKR